MNAAKLIGFNLSKLRRTRSLLRCSNCKETGPCTIK